MLNDHLNLGGEEGGGYLVFYGSCLAPTLLTLENHNCNMGDHEFLYIFAEHMNSHFCRSKKITHTMNSKLIIIAI